MFIQTIRKTGAFNVKNLGADNSPNNTLREDALLKPAANSASVYMRFDTAAFFTG